MEEFDDQENVNDVIARKLGKAKGNRLTSYFTEGAIRIYLRRNPGVYNNLDEFLEDIKTGKIVEKVHQIGPKRLEELRIVFLEEPNVALESLSIQADRIFQDSLSWLQENYRDYVFYTERDLLRIIEDRLVQNVQEQQLPFLIINDYQLKSTRYGNCDSSLVIARTTGEVDVVSVIRYEPNHKRHDLLSKKLPITPWEGRGGIRSDIYRALKLISRRKTNISYVILFDEGRFFREQRPFFRSHWVDWDHGVSLLFFRIDIIG